MSILNGPLWTYSKDKGPFYLFIRCPATWYLILFPFYNFLQKYASFCCSIDTTHLNFLSFNSSTTFFPTLRSSTVLIIFLMNNFHITQLPLSCRFFLCPCELWSFIYLSISFSNLNFLFFKLLLSCMIILHLFLKDNLLMSLIRVPYLCLRTKTLLYLV